MRETMEITVACPVRDSFRVAQVGGMFDLPVRERAVEKFRLDLPPGLDEEWTIGLIVGPSGSGKSTVARKLYGESLYMPGCWEADAAVIDQFGALGTKEIVRLLTAVGFSSPPGWV